MKRRFIILNCIFFKDIYVDEKEAVEGEEVIQRKEVQSKFHNKKYLHCFAIRTAPLMLKMSTMRKNRQMENLSRVRR